MRILLLSFYFQPDLSAGSFRTTALVRALLDRLPANASLEVITTQPNRYSSFSLEAPFQEQLSRLTIHRVPLSHHNSGMLDQSRAFLGYARRVIGIVGSQRYDLVYATSSRLMTASLGAVVARRIGCPLYLDIRDIFVDTIKDVLPAKFSWLLKPVFSLVESLTIRAASRVNVVSAGFLPYFQSRYPKGSFVVFTNGIDNEFLEAQPSQAYESQERILTVLYAGNIGEGQGLHSIIPSLAKRYEGRLRFLCIGDGGRKKRLEQALDSSGVTNVEIVPPICRADLISAYQEADVLFLHLNDCGAFRKVLPSKLFEYAALGKPIWAGVAGYSAEFIHEYISNAVVFSPCNVDEAERSFASLDMMTAPRPEFVKNFSRANIMQALARDIILLKQSTSI